MTCSKCEIDTLAGFKQGPCAFCGDTGDLVNHPLHYTSHPSNVECIEIVESMDFCTGNAFKYVWRFREKHGREDLAKAVWYVEREIARRGDEQEDSIDKGHILAKVIAHETNPALAIILWLLTAGDAMRGDRGTAMLREARVMIEELVRDTEPTTR
jgi:hypothetical protein